MGAFDREQLEQLAGDYEAGDASAEMEQADYDDSTTAEPMVTTSLRLPKPVMDAVRAAADLRGVRPTALMREWVEQHLLEQAATGEQVIPISAVLAFLAETATRTTNRHA